jgi:hypothetical protein
VRIRSIRPQFWRSDAIVKLRRDVRLLLIGLWSYVDDNGVGIDDYRDIAADLFAREDDPVGARNFVRDGLATLAAASLIVRYEYQGKRYLYVSSWDEDQRVDKPGKPRFPRPDECGATTQTASVDVSGPEVDADGGNNDEFATVSRDSRDGGAPGEGEKGRRGEGEDSSSQSGAHAPHDDIDAPPADDTETKTAPAETKTARTRRDQGTRLPDDFPATPAMAEWAREKAPLCGPEDHEAFCDYWRSQPGAKGRKTDWIATWRNWMRREQKAREGRPGTSARPAGSPRPSRNSQIIDAAMERAIAAEKAMAEQAGQQQNGRFLKGELTR